MEGRTKKELILLCLSKGLKIPTSCTKSRIIEILTQNQNENQNEDQGGKIEQRKEETSSQLTKKEIKYSFLELSNVFFEKNIFYSKDYSITLELLKKEIENPEFIKEYSSSLQKLYLAKLNTYKNILNNLISKRTRLETTHERYRVSETSELPFLIIEIEKVKTVVKEIEKLSMSSSDDQVKKNLKSAIYDEKEGLLSLVGREDIKNDVSKLIYSFSKSHQLVSMSFNNIIICGDSGTGKTTIAKTLSFVFCKCGFLVMHLINIVSRQNIVAGYIGQTAKLTKNVLIDSMEGILFIDEAHQLFSESEKDFGPECINEIVNHTDKFLGCGVIIFAGYKEPMQKLMKSNQGLERRFPIKYTLEKYDPKQLTDIFFKNMEKILPPSIEINSIFRNFMYSVIKKMSENEELLKYQAGDILNFSIIVNKTITSSYLIKWDNSKFKTNLPILLCAIQTFLQRKGYGVGIHSAKTESELKVK